MTMTNNPLIEALVKTQLEIIPPKKDKRNPHFKSEYCSLDAIYEATRVPLARNGLHSSHTVELIGERYFVRTLLYHVSGEQISNLVPLFIDKLTSQGFQSAYTYAKRSGLTSLLGLPTEDDDDGNEATSQQTKPIVFLNDIQCAEIDELVGDDMELLNRILSGYKVTKLKDIAAFHFPQIVNTLKTRKAK